MSSTSFPTIDEKDIRAAQAGDERALVGIIRTLEPAVRRRCMAKLSSREEAEDVTQQILVKVALQLAGLRTPTEPVFRAWYQRVTSNEIIAAYKRSARARAIAEAVSTQFPPPTRSPEAGVVAAAQLDILAQAARGLSDGDRRLYDGLVLHYSGSELAAFAGIRFSNLTNHRRRMRRELIACAQYLEVARTSNCKTLQDKIIPKGWDGTLTSTLSDEIRTHT
ncbi:MAG: RNA polymerase sigma factor, partial [Actinobacteria bacterium]|nr:RNA polymerase sigma factor [Actinomycetota bacterium]